MLGELELHQVDLHLAVLDEHAVLHHLALDDLLARGDAIPGGQLVPGLRGQEDVVQVIDQVLLQLVRGLCRQTVE